MHIYIKIHYICSNYFTINYHIMKKQILSLILFMRKQSVNPVS